MIPIDSKPLVIVHMVEDACIYIERKLSQFASCIAKYFYDFCEYSHHANTY